MTLVTKSTAFAAFIAYIDYTGTVVRFTGAITVTQQDQSIEIGNKSNA